MKSKAPCLPFGGAAELLEEGMPPAQQQRFLSNIRNEAGRIQEIVERMLALTAIESRRELSEKETIAVSSLVKTVVESKRPAPVPKKYRTDLPYSGKKHPLPAHGFAAVSGPVQPAPERYRFCAGKQCHRRPRPNRRKIPPPGRDRQWRRASRITRNTGFSTSFFPFSDRIPGKKSTGPGAQFCQGGRIPASGGRQTGKPEHRRGHRHALSAAKARTCAAMISAAPCNTMIFRKQ